MNLVMHPPLPNSQLLKVPVSTHTTPQGILVVSLEDDDIGHLNFTKEYDPNIPLQVVYEDVRKAVLESGHWQRYWQRRGTLLETTV